MQAAFEDRRDPLQLEADRYLRRNGANALTTREILRQEMRWSERVVPIEFTTAEDEDRTLVVISDMLHSDLIALSRHSTLNDLQYCTLAAFITREPLVDLAAREHIAAETVYNAWRQTKRILKRRLQSDPYAWEWLRVVFYEVFYRRFNYGKRAGGS